MSLENLIGSSCSFIRNVSLNKEVLVTFWKSSKSGLWIWINLGGGLCCPSAVVVLVVVVVEIFTFL